MPWNNSLMDTPREDNKALPFLAPPHHHGNTSPPRFYPFSMEKLFKTMACVMNFKVFAILEKIVKSMQKWFPKVMKNHSKWHPGAPRVNLFFVFIDFGRSRKNMIFWWGSGATKKRAKSTRGAPGGGWSKLPVLGSSWFCDIGGSLLVNHSISVSLCITNLCQNYIYNHGNHKIHQAHRRA